LTWLAELLGRLKFRKVARIIRALLAHGGTFTPGHQPVAIMR
jgi:hypothetical protein